MNHLRSEGITESAAWVNEGACVRFKPVSLTESHLRRFTEDPLPNWINNRQSLKKRSVQFTSMITLKNLARLALIAAALTINQQAKAATWTSTGSLGTARYGHTATLLPNGKVLVAGGNAAGGIVTSAELYDPAAGTWAPAAPMNVARAFHTATLLPNTKVLVAGGQVTGGSTKTAEFYDPVARTWTLIAPMTTNRASHSATLLPDGKILAAGGFAGDSPANLLTLASAELYDPAAGTWKNTTALSVPRGNHKAVLLSNGQVLLAGGFGNALVCFSSTEIFTPATGQWTNTGAMKSPRATFAALLLPNGTVLGAGGQHPLGTALNTAELYYPAAGIWSWTNAMANARADHTACLLPNGSALFVDGWDNTSDTPTSELYNPTIVTWSTAATFTNPRFYVTATLLPNGKVLAAGGRNSSSTLFSATQLYDTGSGPIPPPTLAIIRSPPNTPQQLAFTSTYGSVFSVIATGNVAAPLGAWPLIGIATETSPGQFQFADSQATNLAQRFYRLRSP